MAKYTYFCLDESCGFIFEITKGMLDPGPIKCPQCNHKIARDYKGDRIATVVGLNQPKTVGDLADKNTEQMVKHGVLPKKHLEHDSNKKKKIDFIKKVERFSKKTDEEKMNYVISGKE